MTALILLSHGDLSAALLRTAEGIVGPIENARAISNSGKSPETIAEDVREAVASFDEASGVMIMVDLFGSSCWRCGVTGGAGVPDDLNLPCAVISGVNLGAVLSFSQKRDTMPLQELAETMANDARRGISSPKYFAKELA
jgi:mannose PTS system EIIA component